MNLSTKIVISCFDTIKLIIMSGVYLIVWNNEDKDKSKLLNPTKGGYPHVTLAYTGDQLSREQLCNIATKVLVDASLRPISLTHAYVNSFTTNTGEERHDVLLGLGVYDTTVISNLRKVYIENSSSYSMHRPHVTHGIYETKTEACRVADDLNKSGLFPYQTIITGVTID